MSFEWILHDRAGRVLRSGVVKNTICMEGLTRLGFYLGEDIDEDGVDEDAAEPDPLLSYVGLIDETGFVEPTAADTMAALPWAEFTSYYEATRRLIDNNNVNVPESKTSVLKDFSISATGTVRGFFVVLNESTKGGTTGYLWAAAAEAAGIAVQDGNSLTISYHLVGQLV